MGEGGYEMGRLDTQKHLPSKAPSSPPDWLGNICGVWILIWMQQYNITKPSSLKKISNKSRIRSNAEVVADIVVQIRAE